MAGISTYLADALFTHMAGGTQLPQPAAFYLALYTDNPTADDAGTEVSGTGYARQEVSLEALGGRAADNDTAIVFPEAGASWGTVTHWGLHDNDTAGNLWCFGEVVESKLISSGDTAKVNAADLDLSLT